jgi:PIN domain nuclease of toxin-antitoxin system
MIVLDASALLAFLQREPGAEVVADVLCMSCLSTVNLAEVLGRFERRGADMPGLAQHLVRVGVELVPFRVADAERAAALLPDTRPWGLSLGDRACVALALARDWPVITADQAWRHLPLGLDVRLIR